MTKLPSSLIFSELIMPYCVLCLYFVDKNKGVKHCDYFPVEPTLPNTLLIESFLHIHTCTLYSSISFLHLFAVALSYLSLSL